MSQTGRQPSGSVGSAGCRNVGGEACVFDDHFTAPDPGGDLFQASRELPCAMSNPFAGHTAGRRRRRLPRGSDRPSGSSAIAVRPKPLPRTADRVAVRFVMEDIMRTPIAVRILLFALVCLVPAACGDSGDNSGSAAPATTTATPATTAASTAASPACADAAALKASMAELDQIDPATAGKGGIQAALDKVRANLAALKSSAKSQWSSQITQLDSALEGLRTTVTGINGDNVLSALPTIVNDLKGIDAAWTALQQKIDQDCG